MPRDSISRRRRILPLALCLTMGAGVFAFPGLAEAGPRDDMKASYAQGLVQFNELEYDAAIATVDQAIASAQAAGGSDDPVLASLFMMRAALEYSNQGDAAAAAIDGWLKQAVSLNYYVVVPLEMRSAELQAYLERARASLGAAPTEKIIHTAPDAACGTDLKIDALLGVPDGGQAAIYWRKAGETDFASGEMVVFSNVAEFTISADQHQDKDISYFIYAFDANAQPVANLGLQDAPIELAQAQACVPEIQPEVDTPEDPEAEEEEKPKGVVSFPRGWFGIGIGTGMGIARGTVENTYDQYFPGNPDFVYGAAQSGCAIARWYAGERLPSEVPGPELQQAFEAYGPVGRTDELMEAYNAEACDERHSVASGLAFAPFHIAPELTFTFKGKMSVSVYSRLQVVTATNVYSPDATLAPDDSFNNDVRSPAPSGSRVTPPFTWAVGAKFKYYFREETKKLRPFLGIYAGYGQSRLRVNMGFSNDANGNSVPDDQEVGADALNQMTGEGCFPVWPYNTSCDDAAGEGDNALALSAATASSSDARVDTVRLGPGFVGLAGGFNYILHKNFGIFAEVQAGGWFPDTGSLLIDLNVGPQISW